MAKWLVRAIKRDRWDGFRRSGIFFSSESDTILTSNEITDAILNEPCLMVVELADEAEVKGPGKRAKASDAASQVD